MTFLEKDPFLCKSTAYSRFKETGLCAQGIVPDLLRIIRQIDPHHWKPHLNNFLEDELQPIGIVMEYIPNLQRIDITNYTKDRAVALQTIIREIHKVRVVHGDPYPRNMMVQPDTGRVFWIDFDRAQTLPYGPLNFYVYDWFKMDIGMTDQPMEELVGFQIPFETIILPCVVLLTILRLKIRRTESSLLHGASIINIHEINYPRSSFSCTHSHSCILDLGFRHFAIHSLSSICSLPLWSAIDRI